MHLLGLGGHSRIFGNRRTSLRRRGVAEEGVADAQAVGPRRLLPRHTHGTGHGCDVASAAAEELLVGQQIDLLPGVLAGLLLNELHLGTFVNEGLHRLARHLGGVLVGEDVHAEDLGGRGAQR